MPTLYPFQHAGLKHLLTPMPSGKRAKLLAWDMGTGKTPIACTALVRIEARQALILCPAGEVKSQWAVQLVAWGVCQWSDIYIVDSLSDVIPESARFIIANYEQLLSRHIWRQLYRRSYDAIIVDEAQRLKDVSAKVTARVFGKNRANSKPPLIALGKWKWFLSGTISPNVRPLELYPILRTMVPECIAPYLELQRYIRRWCGWKGRGASHVDEFKERTKDFIHHVKLKDVWHEMPEIVHSEVYFDLGLTDEEHEIIHRTMELATIRKTLGDLIAPHAIKYIAERLDDKPEEKLVVFAWTRSVIESLHESFKDISVKYYGGMSKEEKRKAKFSFCNSDKIKLFIGQLRASGIGVDGLQSVSSSVIKVEPDWVDGDDEQATARVLRLGQTQNVHETRLLAVNTLHETIHWNRKQKAKRTIFDKAVLQKENESMSLEQALQENTKALIALTEAMAAGNGNGASSASAAAGAKEEAAPASGGGAKSADTKSKTAVKAKITRDDVRAKASKTIETLSGGGPPTPEAKKKVKDLLKEVGKAEKIDDLDEKLFASFTEALDGLLSSAGEDEGNGDDLEV